METGVNTPQTLSAAPVPKADPVGDFVWGILGLIVCSIAGGVSALLGSYAGFAVASSLGMKRYIAPGSVTNDLYLLLPGLVCGGLLGPAALGTILVGGLHSAKGIAAKFALQQVF